MMQKSQNRIFVKAKCTTSANIRFYVKERSKIILNEAQPSAVILQNCPLKMFLGDKGN